MDKYLPSMYQESIYTIDYRKLYKKGIRCILYDLDNTIATANSSIPPKEAKELFSKLKDDGFEIIIFSNSPKFRLKIFTNGLCVEGVSSARKPFPGKLNRLIKEKGYSLNEVAIIGDQLLTDVKVGNKVGITTILIKPISQKDFFVTRVNRFFEERKIKKLTEKNLFHKDRYYE